LGEFDVTAKRVVDPPGPPDFPGGRPNGIDLAAENEIFDLLFDLVVEFVAVVPEKFDAVVFVRIMRSRENDPRVRAERARDVGDPGRRERTDQEYVHAEGGNAGHESILEH